MSNNIIWLVQQLIFYINDKKTVVRGLTTIQGHIIQVTSFSHLSKYVIRIVLTLSLVGLIRINVK